MPACTGFGLGQPSVRKLCDGIEAKELVSVQKMRERSRLMPQEGHRYSAELPSPRQKLPTHQGAAYAAASSTCSRVRISFSIPRRCARSLLSHRLIAMPACPARAVRPMRWT